MFWAVLLIGHYVFTILPYMKPVYQFIHVYPHDNIVQYLSICCVIPRKVKDLDGHVWFVFVVVKSLPGQ